MIRQLAHIMEADGTAVAAVRLHYDSHGPDQLWWAWRAGDRRAGELVFAQLRELARKTVSRLCHGENEDIVQDALVETVVKAPCFEGRDGAKVTTWFFQICRSTCLRAFRRVRQPGRKGRTVSLAEAGQIADDEGFVIPLVSEGRRPDELLAEKETVERFLGELERCPVRQAIPVIRALVLDGLDQPEIARCLGSCLSTVRTRLHYGRKALAHVRASLAT